MTTLCAFVMALATAGNPMPESDRQILAEVAAEYKLDGDARLLLFAIYHAERGGPGREMGILTTAAQRYKGDHAKSLRTQGQWAAGTIKRRFTGDLEAFGRRYCPPEAHALNVNWTRNVRYWMNRVRSVQD